MASITIKPFSFDKECNVSKIDCRLTMLADCLKKTKTVKGEEYETWSLWITALSLRSKCKVCVEQKITNGYSVKIRSTSLNNHNNIFSLRYDSFTKG